MSETVHAGDHPHIFRTMGGDAGICACGFTTLTPEQVAMRAVMTVDHSYYVPEHGIYRGNSRIYTVLMNTRTSASLADLCYDVNSGDSDSPTKAHFRRMPKHVLAAMVCEWDTPQTGGDTWFWSIAALAALEMVKAGISY